MIAVRWLLPLLISVAPTLANDLSVTVDNTEATEGSSTNTHAEFIVTLSAAQSEPVAVSFSTFQLTPSLNLPYPAQSGSDFSATNGTVVFQPGETNKLIAVAICDDDVNEAIEPFGFGLSGASRGNVGPPARCDILDTDVLEIWFNDPVVVEGQSGTTYAEFTLSTSRATEQALHGRSTTFSLWDGTADASDFYKTGGWWSLAPGPARTNVLIAGVQVFGDMENENDETFYLALAWDPARNVTLRAPGRCTIINDDFRLQSTRGSSNRIALALTGASGATHILQWSTNLVDWISFSTNAVGPDRSIIREVTADGDRFFRAQLQMR